MGANHRREAWFPPSLAARCGSGAAGKPAEALPGRPNPRKQKGTGQNGEREEPWV